MQPFKENRRKGPDFLINIVNFASIVTWILFILALISFHYAKPELETLITRAYQLELRERWIETYLRMMQICLLVCGGLSITALILQQKRTRRRSDTFRYHFIISGLLACTGLAASLFISEF